MIAKLIKINRFLPVASLIFLGLFSCKKIEYGIKTIKATQIEINSNLASDSSLIEFIEPYKNELDKKVNAVISYSPKTLTRTDGKLQSSLGNIYADMCYSQADSVFYKMQGKHIDMAFFNYGGVREAIPKGDIKVANIFKLMPFENMLVVTELNGKKMQELFAYFEKNQLAHPFYGAQIIFKNDKIEKIKIGGKDFDPEKTYLVLTSDYLQHGGDRMDFFKNPVNLYNLNYKVRDALLDYLKKTDTLKSALDQRVIIHP